LLIVVAAPAACRQLLAQAQVQEIPVPAQYGGGGGAGHTRMLERLGRSGGS
jgi:hypothetical protein